MFLDMDEQSKSLAMQYMRTVSDRIGRTERFPVKLGDRGQMAARLLGCYGAMVESRGADFIMDDNTVSKVESVVKWMYSSRKRGLLLCGTIGNGKTTMLRAISYLFGSHAMYMEAQSIYDHFRQSRSFPSFPSRGILLIDDLGVEPPSSNDFGEVRYPLAELLMARYRHNATTVIATNYTLDQIGQAYGDRVLDRMREMFAQLTYIEPSYRK